MEDKELVKKKKFRNNNLFRLFVAILIICACAGLGAGIAIVEDKSDPTEYVAKYFGKFLVQDFAGMYEYIDREDACVTKKSFVNLMTKLYMENNIGEYEFKELQKKNGRYFISVSYKDADTGESGNFDIFLIKYRENIGQLIADWKVSIDEHMIEDVTMLIPEGMELEMDGSVIDEKMANITFENSNTVHTSEGETIVVNPEDEGESAAFTSYKFTKILKGEHQIRALTEYTQIAKDIELTENAQTISCDNADITVNDEYIKLIDKKSPEMIQEFYEVVRKRKSSSKKLLGYFADDDNLTKKLKNLVKKNQEIIYWPDIEEADDYNLIECNFSDLSYLAEYVGDKKFKVVYTFSYDYVSSTDTELFSSYVSTISGNCNTTMELTYSVTDDDIKISDIAIKNKNKMDKEEEE